MIAGRHATNYGRSTPYDEFALLGSSGPAIEFISASRRHSPSNAFAETCSRSNCRVLQRRPDGVPQRTWFRRGDSPLAIRLPLSDSRRRFAQTKTFENSEGRTSRLIGFEHDLPLMQVIGYAGNLSPVFYPSWLRNRPGICTRGLCPCSSGSGRSLPFGILQVQNRLQLELDRISRARWNLLDMRGVKAGKEREAFSSHPTSHDGTHMR